MYHNYFSLNWGDDTEIEWIKKNAKPKWRWDKKFPKREGRRLGVYLDDGDAIIFKMKFR